LPVGKGPRFPVGDGREATGGRRGALGLAPGVAAAGRIDAGCLLPGTAGVMGRVAGVPEGVDGAAGCRAVGAEGAAGLAATGELAGGGTGALGAILGAAGDGGGEAGATGLTAGTLAGGCTA